ncbi:ENT-KAURENOIC ACID OXYDASE 1, cytochrome P450, family 88, subfamily A, polypeptide 3 [Hibiscus trionum]|uniref:ENT-KAURENOIC ACID OXYDASE 1, cytochrome P450, family 88, subfamily A, polypeptide 3 n=1 Tax=Hibiscus trionum TaxID=183268 RepID=A0A9W7H7D3_HIBTR|nr:ENT-KAURENOIC ACID OXYDASE 1, cytochrome P450, family 88, subfamily A, polypeptide 3 [Hibiscus trionum]
MNKISFKVFMNIFLGSGTNDTVIASMENYYTHVLSGLFSTPLKIPGFAYHRAVKARKMLEKDVQGVLTERRGRKPNDLNSKRGLIDIIMEAEDEEGEKLKDGKIVVILLTFLLASRESSGRAASWATTYLYQHLEELQKAKKNKRKS